MVNFVQVRRAQLAKSTLLNSMIVPLVSFQISLGCVQMQKRKWGVERNGKLPHQFITCKTATLVPKFAVEDLPLGKAAALVPEFCSEGSGPWAEHFDDIAITFFGVKIIISPLRWIVAILPLVRNVRARVRYPARSNILNLAPRRDGDVLRLIARFCV